MLEKKILIADYEEDMSNLKLQLETMNSKFSALELEKQEIT